MSNFDINLSNLPSMPHGYEESEPSEPDGKKMSSEMETDSDDYTKELVGSIVVVVFYPSSPSPVE